MSTVYGAKEVGNPGGGGGCNAHGCACLPTLGKAPPYYKREDLTLLITGQLAVFTDTSRGLVRQTAAWKGGWPGVDFLVDE